MQSFKAWGLGFKMWDMNLHFRFKSVGIRF